QRLLILAKLSDMANVRGAFAEALQWREEALTLSRQLALSVGSAEALRDLSVSLNHLGRAYENLRKLPEALAAFSEPLELRRRSLASSGDSPETLRDLSVSLDHLGRVQADLGRLPEAFAAFSESLELRRRLLASSGDSPQILRDL